MSRVARLSLLLRRFGLEDQSSSSKHVTGSQLRAAYYRKARETHPDVGNANKDGADFIQLKIDHEEAQRLLSECSSGDAAWRQASWQPHAPPYAPPYAYQWGECSRYSQMQDVKSPGAPPLMLWVFGGVFAILGVARSFLSKPTLPIGTSSSLSGVHKVMPASQEYDREAELERKNSGYYSKRVKKAEPSDIFQKRPHSKQRGCTYISPVHAAAEEGKAEWLHWVGERSRFSLCQALDKRGQTALHYSARAGQFEASAVLLKFGADPRALDIQGRTPLDLAKGRGDSNEDQDLVKMLKKGPPGPLANNQFRKRPSLRSQNHGICG